MITSWLATAIRLTITDDTSTGTIARCVLMPGGQHGELLVVPLHPGDGEDRRHHADHAAERSK